jgi:hypothetical protein
VSGEEVVNFTAKEPFDLELTADGDARGYEAVRLRFNYPFDLLIGTYVSATIVAVKRNGLWAEEES